MLRKRPPETKLAEQSEMSDLRKSQGCSDIKEQQLEVEKKFPEMKLLRPSSPAPSVLSITSSKFMLPNLVSSTPLPSEIDEESQNGDELETDKSSDNELERTIRDFQNTPLVVEPINPFIPRLVRIPTSDVFEEIEEVDDEEVPEEGEEGASEEERTLQYEKLEDESEATVLGQNSMDYKGLEDDENEFYDSDDDESEFNDLLPLPMPPLVRISTEMLHISMGDSNDYQQDEDVASEDSRSSTGTVAQDPGSLKEEEAVGTEEASNIVPQAPLDSLQDSETDEEQQKLQDYQPEESFESLSSCPGDYVAEVPSDSNQTLLDNHDQALESFIANFAVDAEIYLRNFAPVIRDETVKLQQQVVPVNAAPVYIAEVFSPVHFWFHFEQGVTELMAKMQEDYKKLKPQNLMISDENIKRGLLVACYISTFATWHRAMVVEPLNKEGRARLLYVDYGTVGMCHKSNIKFLYESYLEHPRYAHRGRFFNLKPQGSDLAWSEKQVNKFLFKFSNRELKATVLSHDEAENVYELDLTHKPSSGEVVNIRTWIISHGIATDFELSSDDIYPVCYHFPTFDMLETNFPSFHERSMMTADGINYDLLTETNFLANVSDSQLITIPALLGLLGHKKFKKVKDYYFTEF